MVCEWSGLKFGRNERHRPRRVRLETCGSGRKREDSSVSVTDRHSKRRNHLVMTTECPQALFCSRKVLVDWVSDSKLVVSHSFQGKDGPEPPQLLIGARPASGWPENPSICQSKRSLLVVFESIATIVRDWWDGSTGVSELVLAFSSVCMT